MNGIRMAALRTHIRTVQLQKDLIRVHIERHNEKRSFFENVSHSADILISHLLDNYPINPHEDENIRRVVGENFVKGGRVTVDTLDPMDIERVVGIAEGAIPPLVMRRLMTVDRVTFKAAEMKTWNIFSGAYMRYILG